MAKQSSRLHNRRAPRAGTPEYQKWKEKIRMGMRAAKLRRRKAGLMTFMEVALDLCLPLYSVKRMVELNQIPAIQAGTRTYIRRAAVKAWMKEAGLAAA